MESWPLAMLRQRMSLLPSPSKSPTPATNQAWSVIDVSVCDVAALPDFHSTLAPVLVLRQRMSALPSPSKSAAPLATQDPLPTDVTASDVCELPDFQTVFAPVLGL